MTLWVQVFSATIHPALCEVLTRHDEVTILAYLDDVYVVGPTENLKSVPEDLKSSLLKVGLEICDRKCELYCPSGECCNFQILLHTMELSFGHSCIRNSDLIQSRCIDIAKSGDRLCSELVKLNDSQSSMLILHHCHVPRLNYLTRQLFPVNLQAEANIDDNMTRSSFESIIGYNHLDDIN